MQIIIAKNCANIDFFLINARMIILVYDKVDLRAQKIIRGREDIYIMIKRLIQ